MSMTPGAPDADPGGTAVPSEQGWEPSDPDQESMEAAHAADGAGPGHSGYGQGQGQGHGRHRRHDDDDDDSERNVGG